MPNFNERMSKKGLHFLYRERQKLNKVKFQRANMTKKFLFITNNAEYQYSMRSQLFDLRDSYVQNKKTDENTFARLLRLLFASTYSRKRKLLARASNFASVIRTE